MKAFVAGATGETGQRIVKELVNAGIPVRALVRNLEQGQSLLPPEAQLVLGDVLKPDSLREAMGDATVLLSAIGARPSLNPTGPYQVDYQGTKNLIDMAKETNIDQFVMVSSLCVSRFFHPLNLFWLVLFWKKQAETELQKSGLNYTIVRPGGLRNEDTPDAIVMSQADTQFDGSIPRTKVAQVCVASLQQPQAKNKILEITSQPEAPNRSWEKLLAEV
ncbi:MAG: epimerase [Cyanobacteria bacterium SW_9_44_58]|nr:MAG: epimerase [Cyanobacteria bacterium SW_9_44_58]